MRVSTAFFAGIGTVVVAIGVGLGGGLLLGNIMSPQQPKYPSSEVTRLEQRKEPPPIQAMNAASQPVPYLPATQGAAQPQPQQPQVQQVSTQPAEPQVEKQQSEKQQETTAAVAPVAPPPATTTEQAATRDRAAPEDAYAKARDADLKREARRAEDRRKAERRQQWAEQRKQRQRSGDDLDDVEASVRQATEHRSFFGREEARSRPVFGGDAGFGRIKIFDAD